MMLEPALTNQQMKTNLATNNAEKFEIQQPLQLPEAANVIPLQGARSESESWVGRLINLYYGDAPPEGLPFRQAIQFITEQKDHRYGRALEKFRRYLAGKHGWSPARIAAWLKEPDSRRRWDQFQLATHRYDFNRWSTRQKRLTGLRGAKNLKNQKKFSET